MLSEELRAFIRHDMPEEGKESDANMNKLLAELQKLGPEYGNPAMRRARFRTVIAYKDKKGELHTFEGVLEGHIACRKAAI